MTILMDESISLDRVFSRIISPAYRTVMAPLIAPFLDMNHFSRIPIFYMSVADFSVKLFIARMMSSLFSLAPSGLAPRVFFFDPGEEEPMSASLLFMVLPRILTYC